MACSPFAQQLARYGPQRSVQSPVSLREARAYCRRLARSHYENFTVASLLLPRSLRPHFYHVYAYCRWADDLADETEGGDPSLALLDWWEEQLHACYEGRVDHPVFIALAETITQFDIPPEPLLDLLVAFRQDQRPVRYETTDELLDYCRYSANPVGRLVLYLGRCHDEQRGALADSICTGLQLANFWQDVARDWDAGRVYLPRQVCRQFGYRDDDFRHRRANRAFREMLRSQVDEAQRRLQAGLPLAGLVGPELRIEVELFAGGGLALLEAIRRCDYDVWSRRPVVTRRKKFALLLKAWWGNRRGRGAGGP